jgi:hypothetical protein
MLYQLSYLADASRVLNREVANSSMNNRKISHLQAIIAIKEGEFEGRCCSGT